MLGQHSFVLEDGWTLASAMITQLNIGAKLLIAVLTVVLISSREVDGLNVPQ